MSLNFEHYIPYFLSIHLLLCSSFFKILSDTANSVDPDISYDDKMVYANSVDSDPTAPSGAV